jgi:hypothetical protein
VPTQQDIPRLLALRETRRRGGLARNQNAALTEIERRFQQIAEPAAAMATGMLAEPVSGIVGMAALPFGADVAANAVRNTQQGLTYQPRTEAGQQGMQALQGFMQPIAETVSRQTDIASKVLAGNAGFDVNTPGGQFLTGMLPALAASAPGFTAARAIPGRRFEMGDIGAGGVGSRQRGMFAGVRAKTADFDALDNAKNMEGQGASRDQIWNKTGWFKDVDNQWKFEIDDSASMSTDMADWSRGNREGFKKGESAIGGVDEFFAHDELTKTYDGMMNFGDSNKRMMMKVSPDSYEGGSYNPNADQINIGENFGFVNRNTALHELQHGIQEREGFAVGGGTQKIANQLAQRKQRAVSRIGAVNLELRRVSKEMDESSAKRQALEPQYQRLMDERSQYVQDAQIDIQAEAFSQYQRLAGEAEARNVETRRDFTPQQRRASAPWSTLDVPENELIIRRTGGNKE